MNTETFRFFDRWCPRYRVRIQTSPYRAYYPHSIFLPFRDSANSVHCRKFQSARKITFQNRFCEKFSLETLVQSISQPHKISPLHFHSITEVVNYPNQSGSVRFDSVCIRLDLIRSTFSNLEFDSLSVSDLNVDYEWRKSKKQKVPYNFVCHSKTKIVHRIKNHSIIYLNKYCLLSCIRRNHNNFVLICLYWIIFRWSF